MPFSLYLYISSIYFIVGKNAGITYKSFHIDTKPSLHISCYNDCRTIALVVIHLRAQSRGSTEAVLVTLAGQRSPTPPLHPDNDSHHPIPLSPVDLIETGIPSPLRTLWQARYLKTTPNWGYVQYSLFHLNSYLKISLYSVVCGTNWIWSKTTNNKQNFHYHYTMLWSCFN